MKVRNRFLLLAIFILVASMVVSCGVGPERSRKPSTDWGRGLPIGTDAVGTVDMVVEVDGAAIHAVWPFGAEDGRIGIRYLQLKVPAQIHVDQEVMQIQGQTRSPRLFHAGNGFLHLVWANRLDTTVKWQLWYAQIDQEGILQGVPVQITNMKSGVSQYAIAEDQDGGIIVAWEDRRSGGINLTGISAVGEIQADPTLVVAAGQRPDLRIDQQGQVHLMWVDEGNNLRYSLITTESTLPVSGEMLIHIPQSTGATMDGPALGLSDGLVYAFWSILFQSGLEAGTARTEYVSFPQGSPEKISRIAEIPMLPYEEQPYRPYSGSFSYTQLVPAAFVSNTTPFIYAPAVVSHPAAEIAVALAALQPYRLDSDIQIAVAFLKDGAYQGYAIATKTQAISSDPVFSSDGTGNLHLIWRDGYSKERVYYTTTDTATRAELDRPTLRDITTLVLSGGLESLTGILLFPLAFPWLFPGLVLVVLWRLIRNDEDLSNKVSQALLVIAIFLYQGSKALVFPTIAEYVPFSAWVDIPAAWQIPLRILIPLLILGIAVGGSELVRRRGKSQSSTLRYYLSVTIIDMILTLAVYGVNFLGAY